MRDLYLVTTLFSVQMVCLGVENVSRTRARLELQCCCPASYHDGKNFPADAKSKQFMDFSEYTSIMDGFWGTVRAVNFEPILKKFAKDAAIIIRGAPAYDDSFPVTEVDDSELQPLQTSGARPMDSPPRVVSRAGYIYTFYSYKGGVGRSMALVNVGV